MHDGYDKKQLKVSLKQTLTIQKLRIYIFSNNKRYLNCATHFVTELRDPRQVYKQRKTITKPFNEPSWERGSSSVFCVCVLSGIECAFIAINEMLSVDLYAGPLTYNAPTFLHDSQITFAFILRYGKTIRDIPCVSGLVSGPIWHQVELVSKLSGLAHLWNL